MIHSMLYGGHPAAGFESTMGSQVPVELRATYKGRIDWCGLETLFVSPGFYRKRSLAWG